MRTLRNIFRRKIRAFLTIFGIIIGVFALVVMGAMAEKLNLLVAGGTKFYRDKVVVNAPGGIAGFAASPLSKDKIKEIEKVEGVEVASASIGMTIDEDIGAVNMGPPPSIEGTDLRGDDYESFEINIAEGRDLEPGDSGKVVVGADLLKKLDVEVGKDVKIRGKNFEVIGIYDKTLTAPDAVVVMSLIDAQKIYHKSLPKAIRSDVNPYNLATGITVYIKGDENPDKMAKKIEKEVKDIEATGPKQFEEEVANQLAIFTSIIFGIALISLLVGGLSVINTMTMSVSERTREIGIRKAIGATDGAIVRQFLAESAVIGFIGGVIGLVLGVGVTILLNSAGNEAGTPLFLVTARLAIGSVVFALFLGVISGLFPAFHAARLNPVEALRYE